MNQERKRILELVQNGKLTAQEAIILLEALEDVQAESSSPKSESDNQISQSGQSEPQAENTGQQQVDSDQQATSSQTDTDQADKKTTDSEQQSEEQSSAKSSKDDFYSQIENAGERIFDFVSTALNKLKDIDLQFTQPIDVPHTFQHVSTEFESIDIDIANGPVRISTWDQPDVRVECQAKIYRAEDREQARRYFIENTVFSIENGQLYFGTQSKWMKVETVIYVPNKQYNKINVKIFNGGLTGEQLSCDHLSAKTTNGKIDIAYLEGNQIHVETVNGQIKMHHVTASKVESETVNGAIDLSGAFVNVEMQTFNGNITCAIPEVGTNRIEAKAVTGNIHLNVPEAATIDGDIRSNLGNYQIELEGINVMHEKKDVIQKQVKFERKGSDDKVIHLHADTKTGSVFIRKADA